MLVRLFGRNFGAFRDGFDLSLEAMSLPSVDHGYFEVAVAGESKPMRLLRLAAIYGPNASGKSTLIRAADALSDMVVRSGPKQQEGERIEAYVPFLLDRSRKEPVTLGCEVVVPNAEGPGSLMEYEITFTATEVVSERIIERRGDRELAWLDRSGTDEWVIAKALPRQMTVDLAEVTRRNASALSVAAQLNQAPLLPVFHAVSRATRALVQSGPLPPSLNFSVAMLHDSSVFRTWVLEKLIQPADVGIVDVTTKEVPLPASLLDQLPEDVRGHLRGSLQALFTHRGDDGNRTLDFESESSGTQKLLALSGPWYQIAREGLCAFFDELSASLHPSLLVALLSAFNTGPEERPSQVVFTTHDLTPLETVLRRDQVFFTDKSDHGVAELFALSDFKEHRNQHNIRKRYLEGRYGAVPRHPDFEGLVGKADQP